MRKRFEITQYAEAIYYQDELPNIKCTVDLITSLKAIYREELPSSRSMCIEMNVIAGPRTRYGLLGGHWKSAKSDKMELLLPKKINFYQEFDSCFKCKFNKPIFGLLPEHRNVITQEFSGVSNIGAGQLILNCVAQSENSCPLIFSRLAYALKELIFLTQDELCDDRILQVLLNSLKRQEVPD